MLPKQFQTALERVRAGADVMPRKQLEQVRGEWAPGLLGNKSIRWLGLLCCKASSCWRRAA